MSRLTLILIAFMLTITPGKSQDFNLDGIYYNFSQTTDGEVEVTFPIEYRHDHWNGEGDYYGHIDIPEIITHEGRTYRVTAIGMQAFRECPAEKVTIPKTIEYIGWDAFRDCSIREIEVLWKTPLDLAEMEEKYFLKHSNPSYSRTVEEIFNFTESEFEQMVLVVPKGYKLLYEQVDIWNRFPNIVEKEEYAEQKISILGGVVTFEYTEKLYARTITITYYEKQSNGSLRSFSEAYCFEPLELDCEVNAMKIYFEVIIKDFFEDKVEGMGQKVYDAFIEEGGIRSVFDMIQNI